MTDAERIVDVYGAAYITEYYDSLTQENREIGEFLLAGSRSLEGLPGPLRALDVGCGPTMLYWALFLPVIDEHNGMDVLPGNIAAVRAEVDRGLTGDSPTHYAPVTAYLDGRLPPVQDRFGERCRRIGALSVANAAATWPAADQSMALVTAMFSLEVLPDLAACRRALAEARRVLRAGGRLLITAIAETTQWHVGDHIGRSVALTAEALGEALAAAGFVDVVVERRVAATAVDQNQGYQWILFGSADVPRAAPVHHIAL